MTHLALTAMIFGWILTIHPSAAHNAVEYQRIQVVSARIAASARSQAARELGSERRAAALLTAVEWRNGLRTPVSVTQVVTALHVCAGEPEAYRLSALFGPGCTARKASKETMMYAEWLQKRVQ